ncbi:helicase-associated domain-containing protein [Rhodoluna sp.]|uniref:helicase-associated domain-containing protein n=1 Tax=Rhodoluna sp. TaxID=1969481 RepID=UPI0025E83AC2|nr:helicase-associated domain-containing protein [Rhodoluna sp.]
MSELLGVAAALRQLSDQQLQTLIAERIINTSSLNDFFDLAEAITKPNNVAQAISGLPLRQARALAQLVQNQTADSDAAACLQRLLLIDAEHKPFESTVEAFGNFAKLESLALVDQESFAPHQNDIDRDCGIEIFETLQAITELIFDLEQRLVTEVGKKSVGLPAIKRLASHLKKNNDYAKAIYELAYLADLMSVSAGRWHLTPLAKHWLDWSQKQRFEHLAKTWRNILGDASSIELIASLGNTDQTVSLEKQLSLTYPFADGAVASKIVKLATLASLIGISANGWLSSWGRAVILGNASEASKAALSRLPEPQRKIICQADLTLIAPGPLPTDVEILIRRFADTEQIGMASTYRLSALSMSHGLETGLTATQIRTALEELSGKALPQPIDYLINESEKRFKRLTIVEGDETLRSVLRSTDPILITEINNEQKLKPFSLRALPDGTLASRFEPELLYFGLRELGFAAVRVDSAGNVISPLNASSETELPAQVSTVVRDLERIRQGDPGADDQSESQVFRQIQLAIKNKARMRTTVKSNSGAEIEFTLEPIGLANGRLRAKDRKADIERTLPLTSILKVVLD